MEQNFFVSNRTARRSSMAGDDNKVAEEVSVNCSRSVAVSSSSMEVFELEFYSTTPTLRHSRNFSPSD